MIERERKEERESDGKREKVRMRKNGREIEMERE